MEITNVINSGVSGFGNGSSMLDAAPLKVERTTADRGAVAAKKVAKEFEALFVGMMLKSMRETVGKDSLMNGGHGEEVYRSMLDQEYAKALTEHGGIGLTAMLERQLGTPVSDGPPNKGIHIYGTAIQNTKIEVNYKIDSDQLLSTVGKFRNEAVEKNESSAVAGGKVSCLTTDTVELSSNNLEVERLKKAMQVVPDIRSDKVELLKLQIAAGTYQVDAKDVATKLLQGWRDFNDK